MRKYLKAFIAASFIMQFPFLAFPVHAQHKTVATPVNASIEDMHKYGDVAMTPMEVMERQAEMAAWDNGKDMRKWQAEYDDIDNQLPNHFENIIDVLTPQQRAQLPLETKNLYDMKKETRGRKP